MKYIYLSVFFFITGLIIGLIYLNDSLSNIIITESNNSIVSNLKNELTFVNIFSSNIKVVLINILGGLSFGVLTFLNLIYNGIVMAYLLKVIYMIDTKLYLVLLPHSFEIIGFIIAGVVGIELGAFLFHYIFLGKKKLNTIKIYKKITLSILIIFISALIEVYISPNVI